MIQIAAAQHQSGRYKVGLPAQKQRKSAIGGRRLRSCGLRRPGHWRARFAQIAVGAPRRSYKAVNGRLSATFTLGTRRSGLPHAGGVPATGIVCARNVCSGVTRPMRSSMPSPNRTSTEGATRHVDDSVALISARVPIGVALVKVGPVRHRDFGFARERRQGCDVGDIRDVRDSGRCVVIIIYCGSDHCDGRADHHHFGPVVVVVVVTVVVPVFSVILAILPRVVGMLLPVFARLITIALPLALALLVSALALGRRALLPRGRSRTRCRTTRCGC